VLADLHERVAGLLATGGQRYTSGRRRVVDVLSVAAHPLTIPEILAEDHHLAQSSVYRSLAILERAGAVQRVVTMGEWSRFELAEELTEHHHHHLICSACGAVRDVEMPADLERTLDRSLGRLAEQRGFMLTHHRLDLMGRCDACA
jgi:Fe2+ or Zn2+ uptake regulation protein